MTGADTSRGIPFEEYTVENYPGEGENDDGEQVWTPDDYSGTSGRRADPQPVVEKLRRKMNRLKMDVEPGEPYEPNLSWDSAKDRRHVREMFEQNSGQVFGSDEPILPGFGPHGRAETARDDCGDEHPHVCSECGHAVHFGRTCAQSVCSRCGAAWIRDAGAKKAAKLRRFSKVKWANTPDGSGPTREEVPKHHHQILNPPLDWYAALARDGYTLEEAQDETKKFVKLILDEQRNQGCAIRHSFRGKDKDDDLHTEADDRGFWKEVLLEGREWTDDVRERLAWRPHYHAITVGDWARGNGFTDCIQTFTGWVTHRIASDDGRSLETDGAMCRALIYCLSHGDIEVQHDGPNQSANWEVGSFHGELPDGEGGPLRSTSRFSPPSGDLDWAKVAARTAAVEVLDLPATSTECGADLPAVDDPDQLAEDVLEDMREIYQDLYPDDDGEPVDPESVPNHLVLREVSAGNIRVSLDSSSGEWSVSGFDPSFKPTAHMIGNTNGTAVVSGDDQEDSAGGRAARSSKDLDGRELAENAEGVEAEDRSCSGSLIPLEVARQRGLLEDDDWLASAPHAEEAREADRDHPDDLDPWRYSSPVWDSPTAV